MKALRLHGIVSSEAPTPRRSAEHVRLTVGRLSALATSMSGPLEPDDEATAMVEIVKHHELLSEYALLGDVLPVRFGTAFSSEVALTDLLVRDAINLDNRLSALAGSVEYTLDLSPKELGSGGVEDISPPPPNEGGRAFLSRKRAVRDDVRQRADRRVKLAASLPERLAPIVLDQTALAPRGQGFSVSCALRLSRDRIPDLMDALTHVGQDAAALGVRCTLRGPGPCYSFVDEMQPASDAPGLTAEGAHV